MPARRPFASRGVPRRATTHRGGGAGSSLGIAALVGVLALIAGAIFWIVDPWSSSELTPARRAAVAPTPGPDAALEMVNVGAPTSTPLNASSAAAASAAAGAAAEPTLVPTLRQWASHSSGIIDDPRL